MRSGQVKMFSVAVWIVCSDKVFNFLIDKEKVIHEPFYATISLVLTIKITTAKRKYNKTRETKQT